MDPALGRHPSARLAQEGNRCKDAIEAPQPHLHIECGTPKALPPRNPMLLLNRHPLVSTRRPHSEIAQLLHLRRQQAPNELLHRLNAVRSPSRRMEYRSAKIHPSVNLFEGKYPISALGVAQMVARHGVKDAWNSQLRRGHRIVAQDPHCPYLLYRADFHSPVANARGRGISSTASTFTSGRQPPTPNTSPRRRVAWACMQLRCARRALSSTDAHCWM